MRASEASTLFIDKNLKGTEPYGHLIVLGKNNFQWLEFDGQKTTRWKITAIDRNEKQLTLQFSTPTGNSTPSSPRLVIYPYRDIDNCLVMIRFDPEAEENPVRFATPYSVKEKLPYQTPEE